MKFMLFVCLVLFAISRTDSSPRRWEGDKKFLTYRESLKLPKVDRGHGNVVYSSKKTPIQVQKVESCGISVYSAKKEGIAPYITGGEVTTPHEYPWQVSLHITPYEGAPYIILCGGSLINQEYVLTAAHCLYETIRAEVILGAFNPGVSESSQVILSDELIVHPEWNGGTNHSLNDIALIHLETPVNYDDYILPICLPAYSDPLLNAGELVTLTGWGGTSTDDNYDSSTLNYVVEPVSTSEDCINWTGSERSASTFCTEAGGSGVCSGDSGGPVNYVKEGYTYIRGVTSLSVSYTGECGADQGVDSFPSVHYYLDWISANTGIAIDP